MIIIIKRKRTKKKAGANKFKRIVKKTNKKHNSKATLSKHTHSPTRVVHQAIFGFGKHTEKFKAVLTKTKKKMSVKILDTSNAHSFN
jgi:hypothetical protein